MVNLENIYSPCQSCTIRGHLYSSNNESCQRCEYNIAITALKRILKDTNSCRFCQNYGHLGRGYYGCKLKSILNCSADRNFVINWKAVFEDYGR